MPVTRSPTSTSTMPAPSPTCSAYPTSANNSMRCNTRSKGSPSTGCASRTTHPSPAARSPSPPSTPAPASRAANLIGPLRDLFAATFFFLFGLQVNLAELPPVLVPAVTLAVVTAATKIFTGWWAARRAGVARRGRIRAGTALVARGEFSIVIAELGIAAGVDERLGPLAAAYVLTLAIAGPLLARFTPAGAAPAEPTGVTPAT